MFKNKWKGFTLTTISNINFNIYLEDNMGYFNRVLYPEYIRDRLS